MNGSAKIWSDGAFTLACSLASNACLLASSLLVVRHFNASRAESDHYFLLCSALMLGILAANLGIPMATTKLLSGSGRDARGNRALLRSTFGLTALATVASLALVWVYAAMVSGRPFLHRDVLPLCACILCFAPGKWISGAMQGLDRLRPAAAFEASIELLRFAALLWALRMGWGTAGIIRGWALAGVLHLGIGLWLLRATCRGPAGEAAADSAEAAGAEPRSKRIGTADLRGQAVLSLHLFLPFAGLFGLIHGLTLLLAERGNPGDAARWAVGLQIASLLPLLAGPLGTVLLPYFTRSVSGSGGERSILAAAKPILARTAILLGAATAGLAIGAGPLLALLFPAMSSPGAAVVRVLGLLYLAESFKFALDPLLIALGRWKALARLEAIRIGAGLMLGHWAIGRWSLAGAVGALGAAILLAGLCKWAWFLGAGRLRAGRESHALG